MTAGYENFTDEARHCGVRHFTSTSLTQLPAWSQLERPQMVARADEGRNVEIESFHWFVENAV